MPVLAQGSKLGRRFAEPGAKIVPITPDSTAFHPG
jgi:hypothetical protein